MESPIPQARVVNFSFCHDSNCRFNSSSHLIVRRKLVDFAPGNATAISYTWGEFRRQARRIGHFEDGSDATMVLGEEWVSGTGYSDFIRTLRDLCHAPPGSEHIGTNEFCWIDQLSINQDDDEDVRKTLAKIPDVYRNFNVVVLLPGAMCECIAERGRRTGRQGSNRTPSGPGGTECWNNVGFAYWFQRLWTRQELLYARNVRVRWTSLESMRCPKDACDGLIYGFNSSPSVINSLNVAARLRFYSRLPPTNEIEQGQMIAGRPSYAYIQMGSEALRAYREGLFGMSAWNIFHRAREPLEKVLSRFLRGDELVSESNPDMTEEARLRRFLHVLEITPLNDRRTTQSRDLVVAVWVDCPRYVLPLGYKKMGLPQLIEDAVRQLENKWGISLVTSTPLGLFGNPSYSGGCLWRPSLSEPAVNATGGTINTIWGAYGNLVSAMYPYKLNSAGELPITLKSPVEHIKPLSRSHPMDFESTFNDIPTIDVIQFMVWVCQNWSLGMYERMLFILDREHVGSNAGKTTTSAFYPFMVSLVAGLKGMKEVFRISNGPELCKALEVHMDKKTRAGFRQAGGASLSVWGIDKDGDNREYIYRIVCEMLGLDIKSCQEKGLRLVVDFGSEGIPPRLGLSKINYHQESDISTLSVCTHPPGSNSTKPLKHVMFEVSIKEGSPRDGVECSDYQLVGIWVQPKTYDERGIHGYLPTDVLFTTNY